MDDEEKKILQNSICRMCIHYFYGDCYYTPHPKFCPIEYGGKPGDPIKDLEEGEKEHG